MATKQNAPPNGSAGNSRAWEALTPALSEWILEAVSSQGFVRMTPVQASTIPLFVGHKDVVVEAVTGSGKTLSFLIPVIERLMKADSKKHHVGGIVISPTRELATQIHKVLTSLLAFHAPSAAAMRLADEDSDMEDEENPIPSFPPGTPKIVSQLLVGGSTKPAQDLSIFLKTSPNLLVATPGRLLELLSSPHVHCPQSTFEVLVMDEADRLLDLGFKDDLQRILQRLPKQRRTGLFSASVSEAVDQLIRVGLRNPVRIAVKVKSASGTLDKRTPASLQMSYIITPPTHKFPAVKQILEKLPVTPQKSIIFVSTSHAVDYFQNILPALLPGFQVIPLHGKHQPNVRKKNFTRFSESFNPVILLTTDLSARGLDIPSCDLVIQLDPPSDPKTFLHRCGRAGRAGRQGLAITLLSPGREEDYIPFMEVRKTPISPFTSPKIAVSAPEAQVMTEKIRAIVLDDRALFDKQQRAFVSWVQAYSKHTASSIFRVADLSWTELGEAWGLLKLPKMPELRNWDGDRKLGVQVDFDRYAYKDKQREKHRKQAIEEAATKIAEGTEENPRKLKPEAWSDKKDHQDLRKLRREKKHRKREQERKNKMTEEEKQKEEELQDMIRKVRSTVKDAESDFEGFSD